MDFYDHAFTAIIAMLVFALISSACYLLKILKTKIDQLGIILIASYGTFCGICIMSNIFSDLSK